MYGKSIKLYSTIQSWSWWTSRSTSWWSLFLLEFFTFWLIRVSNSQDMIWQLIHHRKSAFNVLHIEVTVLVILNHWFIMYQVISNWSSENEQYNSIISHLVVVFFSHYLEDMPVDMILRQLGVDSYNIHPSTPIMNYSPRNSFVLNIPLFFN